MRTPEGGARRPDPLSPPAPRFATAPPATSLRFGEQLYVAVPAGQARALAYVLSQGSRALRERDAAPLPSWVVELLDLLHQVDAEHASEPALSVRGSAARTDPPTVALDAPLWAHDTLTVADAVALSGRSASYLCRLARERPGFGYLRAGRWHLNRCAVAALGRGDDRRQ